MYSSTRFSEILNLIPSASFNRSVSEVNADKYTKKFKCKDLLKVMIYGQLSKARSLRNLVSGFNSHLSNKTIPRSTLSEGLSTRSIIPFKNVCELLMKQGSRKVRKECKEHLTLIDATPVQLNINKHDWATSKSGNRFNGLKIHMAIESGESAPVYASITPANVNDITDVKEHFLIKKECTYVMDKGYTDYNWWHKIHESGAYFITRLKTNAKWKVVQEHKCKESKIILDQTIHLTNKSPRAKKVNLIANKDLRRVVVKRDNGDFIELISNDFRRSALEVADCYKKRWGIELFFKWLKQKLKLKSFFGLSENAVRIQIYCTLISYLLMKKFKSLSSTFTDISEVEVWLQHGLFIRDKLIIYKNIKKHKRDFSLKYQASLF